MSDAENGKVTPPESKVVYPTTPLSSTSYPVTPAPKSAEPSRTMDFPDAIREVTSGKKIRRESWGDPKDYGFIKNSWLTIFTKGKFHTWNVNDGDLEGQDWVVILEN